MAKRTYDPTEYLYASARIRALEAHLIGKEQWNQLLSMNSAEEILASLSDRKSDGALDTEAALREGLVTVAESVPHPELSHFIQYPYDCNNVKALIKCRIKGLDPSDLLIDLGTISVKTLLTVSENELLALLPTNMAAALPAAREAYEKTGDPQEIDFILDRAAFADMKTAAAPFPFAAALVTARVDLQNLLICLRLLRMQNGALGRSMLERAMLPGGTLSTEWLLACYDEGENAFYDTVFGTTYAKIFDKTSSLGSIERAADDHLAEMVRKARMITFGAEVPIAYLLALETQSKNLRILLAGKRAGQDRDTIQAKLRACYV